MTYAYQLRDIRLTYHHRCILNLPKLDIASGSCIALLGGNGAGKSTLLKLLAFAEKPHQGSITFFNQKISKQLSPEQRQKIGIVEQQPYLLSGSIIDNIYLALKLQGIAHSKHKELVDQALQLTNLTRLAHQKGHTLSGGELKRAAIARAISYQPEVLLLDEPFSHLDQRHIKQLETILHRYAQQTFKTVIFSTHNQFQAYSLADTSINLIAGTTHTNSPLNLFDGHLVEQYFNTGHIKIHVSTPLTHAKHIAIEPHEITLSAQQLQSSMQNNFEGHVILIASEKKVIHLTIDCGEIFQVIISSDAFQSLHITLGDKIWLSFKSTAVNVF